MFFADDVVVISSTESIWNLRNMFESNELKISRFKTEYMQCKFIRSIGRKVEMVQIKNNLIPLIQSYNCVIDFVTWEP